jgi:hypothetical protein
MSQSDYLYHKKMSHILLQANTHPNTHTIPNQRGLAKIMSHQNYIQYKQYAKEVEGAYDIQKNPAKHQQSHVHLLNPIKQTLRGMEIQEHPCTETARVNGDNLFQKTICEHTEQRPHVTHHQYTKSPSLFARNAYNQNYTINKKLGNIDPTTDFCKCDSYFYRRNPNT